MPYYQLLGPPVKGALASYRGVHRGAPAYRSDRPETDPLNLAWREYVEQDMRLSSEAAARELARRFQEAGAVYDLVLVEAAPEDPGENPPGCLGFDVAQHGNYSILAWGLHWNGLASLPPPPDDALFRLIEAYFRPRLNDHVLFRRWSDARFFLEVVHAIAAVRPGTWEAPGHEKFEMPRLALVEY